MRKRRFISWLLTICLLLGMVPVPAYAEGNTTTTTISGDDTAEKTGTMTITLVIPKKTPAATDLTYTAPSDLTYSGSDKAATVEAASGITGMGNITVKYYSDTARANEATPKNVGTYYVGAMVAEGDEYAASTAVIYGDGWTFTITASTPSAPAAPTKASATKNSITLNAASGCEYSKDGVNWQSGTEFTGLLPGTEYTFYQRVKATANTNASSASAGASFSTEADTYAMTITLTIKEMVASAENVSVAYDGQPHGITVNVTDPASDYTVKYGTTDGTYDLDASPTQTEVGTQTVYYQVTADNYVAKTGSATVTINKANAVAATVTANNRTYDRTDKALVNVTGEATGGEMQYAIGDANGATQPYTTSIPTETNAGTYYVWYKVVGDANHNDTVAKHVVVTIAKKSISLSSDQLPKANTGLEEKYGTQALVTAPKAALPDGYIMKYALGKDGVNAPAEGYGSEIPSGSRSGNYYVWYKAVSSDSNYADTEPVCITVSIAQTVYFSVTFDMNGHGKQIASQAVEYGTKLNKPEDPVAEGYIFDGWYTDKECTKAYDFDSKVEKGFTLYAKWTAEGSEETVSLNSIAITTAPSKTEYKEGEKFDPAGMVVTATYTDKSSKAVSGYTYTPDGALSVSDNKITVSYTENGITCTAEQPISVSANGGSEPAAVSLNSISITTAPAKTEYKEGEKFDPAGMVVTATYTDNSSKAVTGYTYTPDGALSVSDDKITISYTEEGITCTAIQSIKVNANGGGEIIIDPDEVDVWNLFEIGEAHEYILKGVSASENIANSNDNSKKYYDAVLEGDTIKVSLKSGAERKKAASKANAVLSFVLEDGSRIEYTLPVAYEKTALKLSSTSATIKDGVETSVETTILVKRKGGQYEALDLSDATVTYGSANVDTDEGGKLIITASTGMNEKISVSKPGWESAIELKYTISAVKKDVLTVDLGGINTVILNANVADQSFDFPVYLNGEKAGEVSVDDGKKGIASYSDGTLTIAYPEGGVKVGNYTVKLTAGEAKCSVKVKVSAKDLSKAVTLKIKSKYDIVTGEPMRLEAKLKDISGVITEVSVDKEGFTAEIDENGYILVGYEGNAFDSGSTKIGNMTFSLSISDVKEPVEITLKNVKAKKAKLTVKAAAVTLAKDASEVNAVANIVCTYKDSKGVTHLIRPESTEITLKNVEAEVSAEDTGLINISKLSKKKGTIKATLTFKGGVKKKVTITVKRAKK